MQPRSDTSAIILAGGLSRRLGQDKRRLCLWGAEGLTLLEHTVALMSSLCEEVIVVLNDPQAWTHLPAALVGDLYAEGGALGAIYSGLSAASHDYALLVAADMPFLNPGLLQALLDYPRPYDLLIPRSLQAGSTRNQFNVEPLHAIYNKSCLQAMRTTLESGRRQISAFFPQIQVVTIEPEEIVRYDPAGYSFLSINTPEQLAEAYGLVDRT